ncbi:MAG: hypothetical protein IJT75_09095, partial [Bacteroidaceae bacterium]|nr:hypothetical protein [Bacteroidaceae bacterium]
SYHLAFSRKGYHPQEREYTVRWNELTEDTVTLEAISWLKSPAFYFGVGYTLRGLSGLTATIGGVFAGHDLQLAYTLGTASSKEGYWYDGEGILQSGLTYKMNSWSVRYGYQVRLLPRLGFTPQVGFMQEQLTGSLTEGTEKFGDGAKASCMTLGVKLLAVPIQHCYVFLQPEYALALSKDEVFDTVAKGADFSVGSFGLTAGVLVSY